MIYTRLPNRGSGGMVSPLNSIRAAPYPPVGTSLANRPFPTGDGTTRRCVVYAGNLNERTYRDTPIVIVDAEHAVDVAGLGDAIAGAALFPGSAIAAGRFHPAGVRRAVAGRAKLQRSDADAEARQVPLGLSNAC